MGYSQIRTSTVELERLRYNIQMRVAKEMVGSFASENMALQLLENHATDSFVFQLRLFFMGRRVEEICYQHPVNWKEALKLDFYNHLFPFSFLNQWRDRLAERFPVRYLNIKWEARELYTNVAMPQHLPLIRVHKIEEISTGVFNEDDMILRKD